MYSNKIVIEASEVQNRRNSVLLCFARSRFDAPR